MIQDKDILKQNIDDILTRLGGRATLLAATKSVPVSVINSIYDLGVHVIGENRTNELLEKYPYLDKRFEIHFIGRLQRNKVKHIIDKVSLIHSLDSVSLAEEINKRARLAGKTQNCLVEVNLGDEESKGGISLEEVEPFLKSVSGFSNVFIRGLMGVLPKTSDKTKNILFFTKISQKFIDFKSLNVDNIIMGNTAMEILSLGMSHDFKEAVDAGSTLVRVGEGIFGPRS